MSVLSSTYYEDLPDLDRYGNHENDQTVNVHVANTFWEHIHIAIEDYEHNYVEANMTIENAKLIIEALQQAIVSAELGRKTK